MANLPVIALPTTATDIPDNATLYQSLGGESEKVPGSLLRRPMSRASVALLAGTVGVAGVAAILTEPGREGIFVFDSANLSAKVTADPQKGIYIAPTSAPTGASGAWVRRYVGAACVKWFGAKGDGATDDTAFINAAIDLVGSEGGGGVFVPEGTYLLDNSNSGAANWDNHRAIYIGHNNVHLFGEGQGSILKLVDAADCHVVKFGSRETIVLPIVGGSLTNIQIDGSRATQTGPSESVNHWQGVDVSSNSQRIRLANLYIHDCQYYGIGMQRAGIKDSIIENVVIENVGADGIDWKNDDGSGAGNVIRGVSVRNFGLDSASLSNPQAGVDMRSGISFEGISVSGMTASGDLVGVRVLADDPAGTSLAVPDEPTKGCNVRVTGNSQASQIGIRVAARNTQISQIYAHHCGDGIRSTRPDCRYFGVDVQDNVAAGVNLTADTTAATEGDSTVIQGLLARANAVGIIYDSVDNVTVTGDVMSNTGAGHDVRAGCTGIKILGGTCSGNTPNLSDAVGAVVQDVTGIKTKTSVTGNAAIDSVGTKTVVIAHGLGVTPSIGDIQLTLERHASFNVTDWAMAYMWVVSADATNISVQININDASATAGALVVVKATIHSKRG